MSLATKYYTGMILSNKEKNRKLCNPKSGHVPYTCRRLCPARGSVRC